MSGLTERERHLARVVLESCALMTISEADDAIISLMARDGADVLACLPPAPTLLDDHARSAFERALADDRGSRYVLCRAYLNELTGAGPDGPSREEMVVRWLLAADRRLRGAG